MTKCERTGVTKRMSMFFMCATTSDDLIAHFVRGKYRRYR